MADDFFSIEIDQDALVAAMAQCPEAIVSRCAAVAEDTANRIKADAQARVHRRTGLTAEGIEVSKGAEDGYFVVTSSRNPLNNLPLWMEEGTVHERPEKYFFVSADLERNGNEQRMLQAIQDGIDDVGLGE